jgi:hypothetical protein
MRVAETHMPCAPTNLLSCRLQPQSYPDDTSVRYREYSKANIWGDEVDITLIFELTLNTVEKTLAAVKGACNSTGQSCTEVLASDPCAGVVVGDGERE